MPAKLYQGLAEAGSVDDVKAVLEKYGAKVEVGEGYDEMGEGGESEGEEESPKKKGYDPMDHKGSLTLIIGEKMKDYDEKGKRHGYD